MTGIPRWVMLLLAAALVLFGIAASLSPTAYGWVRDTTGSYDPILFAAAVMFIVGAVLLLFLGPYPDLAARDGSSSSTATSAPSRAAR